jgi:hypothetical protein
LDDISFAPPGLEKNPRLTAWAAFFRRFAAVFPKCFSTHTSRAAMALNVC